MPKNLYEALRSRARKKRGSTAAEVISLLKNAEPTAAELKRRKRLYEDVIALQSSVPPGSGPFPTTEEMVREDRER